MSDLGSPTETFITSYTYDGLDRRTVTTDNADGSAHYAYDSRSNLMRSVDALGNIVIYEYDGLDRLVRVSRLLTDDGTGDGALIGIVETFQDWDDSSRLIGRENANGHVTQYEYDALNRMVSVIGADGAQSNWSYNVHNSPVRTLDATGSQTRCDYDGLNRIVGKTVEPAAGVSADTTFEHFAYDGLSRLVAAEDDDATITRTFDSRDNLISETLNGATITHTHDGVGNVLRTSYPGGRGLYVLYDELNRPTRVHEGDAAMPLVIYEYVGPTRVERQRYANGTESDFTYDALKRLVASRVWVDFPGFVLDERTYAYDAMSNKVRRSSARTGGPGFVHDHAYDSIYRLRRATVTDDDSVVVRDTTYTLDGADNRTAVDGGPDAGLYWLDDAVAAPADAQVNQYTHTPDGRRLYDPNGNLIYMAGSGDCDADGSVDLDDYNGPHGVGACLAGPNDTVDGGCGCHDFDDDFDVDLLDFAEFQRVRGAAAPAGATLVYDYRNRLVELTNHGTGVRSTYAYDPLGRRTVSIEDADGIGGSPTLTRYLYDGPRVSEERTDDATTLATYAYGGRRGEVLTMRRGSSDVYYHNDDLGNVLALSGKSGLAFERYEYGDYGRVLDGTTLTPLDVTTTENPYFFRGGRQVSKTDFGNLMYLIGHRLLDPATGRYTTRGGAGGWGGPAGRGNANAFNGDNPFSR